MMRTPAYILALLVGLLALALLGATQAAPAQAQSDTPAPQSACRTCHEGRYYLHDSGRWYCLCGKQRNCVDCHGGNADTYDEEKAHEGMIANPIFEDPAVCQKCHHDNAQAYIEKFSQVAGIDPWRPTPSPTPVPLAMVYAPQAGEPTLLLRPQPLETWRIVGLGLLGLLFLVLLGFAYRCWKADCLARSMTKQ